MTHFFHIYHGRKNYKSEFTTEELQDVKGNLISIFGNSKTEEYNPTQELNDFLDGNVQTSVEYARYWHGYLAFLRPLLLLCNITGIRIILLLLFFSLLIILFILLKKKLCLTIAIIFSFCLIAYDYFFVSYSLQSAPVFITMMISCIVLLLKYEKIKDIYLYFFILGCITNFVDFLTVPLITYAMPMFIYLLLLQKNSNSYKYTLKDTIICLLSWGFGYSLTWISKWVLYDLIYHKDLFNSAIYQVFYRTSSDSFTTYAKLSITNNLKFITLKNENISVYKELFNTLILFLCKSFIYIFLYIFIYGFKLITQCKKNIFKFKLFSLDTLKKIAPFFLIMLFTFIWYIILANHTILHTYFVYRNMLIFLTGFLLCFISSIQTMEKRSIIIIKIKEFRIINIYILNSLLVISHLL